MRDNARIILFASVLGLACSILLAGATRLTEPYRRANEKAEEIRNFLSALEVPVDTGAGASTLLEVFNKVVKVRELNELTLYEYVPEGVTNGSGQITAVAIPFSGMGLWGPVKGVLALEPDLITIRGIRFYQQEETPGLGGEIGSEWFQKQFIKKRMVSDEHEPGFTILKPGGSSDSNSVDGISGATMTSARVESMLGKLAENIFKERDKYVR